jgi:hypothetical protein
VKITSKRHERGRQKEGEERETMARIGGTTIPESDEDRLKTVEKAESETAAVAMAAKKTSNSCAAEERSL